MNKHYPPEFKADVVAMALQRSTRSGSRRTPGPLEAHQHANPGTRPTGSKPESTVLLREGR